MRAKERDVQRQRERVEVKNTPILSQQTTDMESGFYSAIGWRYFEILNIWQTTTSRLKFIADFDGGGRERERGIVTVSGNWSSSKMAVKLIKLAKSCGRSFGSV